MTPIILHPHPGSPPPPPLPRAPPRENVTELETVLLQMTQILSSKPHQQSGFGRLEWAEDSSPTYSLVVCSFELFLVRRTVWVGMKYSAIKRWHSTPGRAPGY
ncbi:hypothetical protein HNY73_002059 [Argiope bruennichi]|uniref:Uncharacterized protein n=1 Tax=Argiope bruennichi TaxID=94029 RepID=A0A8T0FTD2_ARGBR|nr:hypothetical protein HNY73_002059 [Argiope bruennichi]